MKKSSLLIDAWKDYIASATEGILNQTSSIKDIDWDLCQPENHLNHAEKQAIKLEIYKKVAEAQVIR